MVHGYGIRAILLSATAAASLAGCTFGHAEGGPEPVDSYGSSTTSLQVQVESVSGQIGDRVIAMDPAAEAEGQQRGRSATFEVLELSALRAETETAETRFGDPDAENVPVDLIVDVCPIETLVGRDSSDTSAYEYLDLRLCTGEYDCYTATSDDLVVAVDEQETGGHTVAVSSRWADGSELSATLSYTEQ